MPDSSVPLRIVVGISGASGALLGLRLLQVLHEQPGVETHAVVSDAGWLNLRQELDLGAAAIRPLVHRLHAAHEIGATIASGSFRSHAMVIAPCSMRTLAAVAHGLADNLITRAADVMLKERRRLVLMVREAPLNLAHLRNMVAVTEMGAICFPPVPAFYLRPQSVTELVDQLVARLIDLLQLPPTAGLAPRWCGLPTSE